MLLSKDQTGRIVKVENIPSRIISLVPSQTELLFDLGLNEEVIGITKFCIHPKEWFKSKTRVGGTKNLNIEKIKTLQPDLIIANKEENDEHQILNLMTKFPVWISDIKNLDDSLQMIEIISEITGKENEGQKIVEQIRFEFSTLNSKDNDRISCVYLIWNKPLMTVGGDTFISDMIHRAGFENIFAHKKRYPEISPEELEKANPKVILLSTEPFPFKEKNLDDFKKTFKRSNVFLADGEMFSWYGSRLLKSPSYFSELITKIKTGL